MYFKLISNDLLQRDEARRVSGTNTRATVLNGLVADRELSKVVADHLGLDLNLDEGLAVVDTNLGTDHLGQDEHVAQVSVDGVGLLTGGDVALLLPDISRQNKNNDKRAQCDNK